MVDKVEIKKTQKKKSRLKRFLLLSILLLSLLIIFSIGVFIMPHTKLLSSLLSPSPQKGVVEAQGVEPSQTLVNSLRSAGYSGMEIYGYKIEAIGNTYLIQTSNISNAIFSFNSSLLKDTSGKWKNSPSGFIKSELNLTNKFASKTNFNISILLNISYSTVHWNGTDYNLTATPVKFQGVYDNISNSTHYPNIFFGAENKRVGYQDIGAMGGYALAYKNGSQSFIELKVENISLNNLQGVLIDPTYYNMTDGFSTSVVGSGCPTGVYTNNSDFWIADCGDNFIYHIDKSGNNLSDGVSGSISGFSGPNGLFYNGSDFWVNGNNNEYTFHINNTGSNITKGFSTLGYGGATTDIAGLSTNVSSGSPKDFWIIDRNAKFLNHVNRTGGNISDGFSTSAIGSGNPITGITNNSDFWISDATDKFVYHTNSTGGNMTDGFSISAIGADLPWGITSNVTNGFITDFWISDRTDLFVYHISTNNGTGGGDTIYPSFSNYYSNNASYVGVGNVTLNVTVTNTNGTVWATFNSTKYVASNSSGDGTRFNVTILNYGNGTFIYNWSAYGNGSSTNLNTTINFYYTINNSVDTEYPKFSNYNSNNNTQYKTGTAILNVTLLSTNGTVWLTWYNGTNFTASNSSGDATVFNVSIPLISNGTFLYNWSAYGNGSSTLLNKSDNQYYTVLDDITPPPM